MKSKGRRSDTRVKPKRHGSGFEVKSKLNRSAIEIELKCRELEVVGSKGTGARSKRNRVEGEVKSASCSRSETAVEPK